jgi:adenylate cyclase
MAEGEKDRAVSNRGAPQAYLEFLKKGPHPRPTRAGSIVHIADIRQTEFYRDGHPLVRVGADLGGVRTMLAVPLRKDEVELGRFSIYRTDVRPFTDKQIALLQNFAAQAVIAMENARLLGDLQQRTAELTARDADNRALIARQMASIEVLKAISASGDDPQPVLNLIVRRAHELCNAHAAVILEYDGTLLHQRAWDGRDPVAFARVLAAFPRPPGRETIPGRVVLSGQVVHIADVQADPEIYDPGRGTGARAFFAVPLLRDERVIGVLGLTRYEPGEFDEFAVTLVQSFAEQAVIAMENARLLGELRQRTHEVAELNRGLEMRVVEQVEELGRVSRLKRFLAPQPAELIVSQGDEKILESHRREIVVVFCDLRGYTAFTETAEPEEVLDFLREYHGALGPLVSQFEGTLDQFSGDGIMVFFNDPVPIPDPAERAVKMAMVMREEAGKLIATWRRDGCELGFGVGIAQGYATLGQIGFSERSGYTAIGTVCNLAARLCAEAKDGQILISSRVARAVEAVARLEDLGNLELKGLRRPVAAFNVVQSSSAAEARPNLTVVARRPEPRS